jgi:hypothetical protein
LPVLARLPRESAESVERIIRAAELIICPACRSDASFRDPTSLPCMPRARGDCGARGERGAPPRPDMGRSAAAAAAALRARRGDVTARTE